MTDVEAQQVPTLLERMMTVYSEEKARSWLGAGRVVVDGEVVQDPDTPCPKGQDGARWLISGG